ncbi:hypothetical protein vBAmePPT11V19_00074 [Alteromonas phage vB_AmeP_PT11-V19]|nr:hypothetical protein vBAmePPT11V19_00074 [Alteromonas phage vB_AmeP_PT11-V19]
MSFKQQLDQLEALAALSEGKEIQYLDHHGIYREMDAELYNPIRRPKLTWRVKPEEWEESYDLYIKGSDFPDDAQSEEAYKAGWYHARERHG